MNLQKYQPVAHLTYHFVWGPMRAKPCLRDEAAVRLEELIREKAKELSLNLRGFRVMPDCVYVSVSAPPTLAPHRIACQFKAHTSRVLRREFSELMRLPSLWTRAYVVLSGDHLSPEQVLAEFEALRPARRPRGRPPKQR
jgi:putative transposase